jgi:hypothetical protein
MVKGDGFVAEHQQNQHRSHEAFGVMLDRGVASCTLPLSTACGCPCPSPSLPLTSSSFPASLQVLVLEPEKELRWRGRLFGSDWWFVGEHYFRFAPLPERKGTKLEHGEQFSGLLVGLLGAMLTQTEKEFQGWNEQLKATLDAGKERGRR